MARHKDKCWNLADSITWEGVNAALLMDLRDELKKLNAVFSCHRFQDIPHNLDAIRKNTTKKKRKKST